MRRMKKHVLILGALLVLASSCYGRDALPAVQKGETHPPLSHKPEIVSSEIIGLVESVILADPAKGARPEISIIDAEGKKYTFIVESTTTIYGPDWKAITLDKLEKGRKVRIRYTTTKEKFLIALSIKPVIDQ